MFLKRRVKGLAGPAAAPPAHAAGTAGASKDRLRIMLLAGVGVLCLAYWIRVRPMQVETEEILTSIESGAADTGEPDVDFPAAAYVESPEKALAMFYADVEAHVKSAGMSLESRQVRVEPDDRYPATPIIFEGRAKGRWQAVTRFAGLVRSATPRIRLTRLTLNRGSDGRDVEIFFEARALAMPRAGGEA